MSVDLNFISYEQWVRGRKQFPDPERPHIFTHWHLCENCSRTFSRSHTYKCSCCRATRYCSQACQSKHWIKEHRQKCPRRPPSTLLDQAYRHLCELVDKHDPSVIGEWALSAGKEKRTAKITALTFKLVDENVTEFGFVYVHVASLGNPSF